MRQRVLFDTQELPAGMQYRRDFISPKQEAALLARITELALSHAKYREFTAKRRILSYGGSYDFSRRQLMPAEEIPEFLHPLREQVALWLGLPAEEFAHALIAEYVTGTQLGWHRDVPNFDIVVGISLGNAATMRFRPYPPPKGRSKDVISFTLEPRSAYVLRDDARWNWQHSIPPTKATRYSITFRTKRILLQTSRRNADLRHF